MMKLALKNIISIELWLVDKSWNKI